MDNKKQKDRNFTSADLPELRKYSKSCPHLVHSIYVQCVGYNSGRPLNQPTANCFQLTCSSATDQHKYYWICYLLWQGQVFYPIIKGSVIPFITIYDFKKVLAQTINTMALNDEKLHKMIDTLQKLEQLEKLTNEKLQLIRQSKIVLISSLIK